MTKLIACILLCFLLSGCEGASIFLYRDPVANASITIDLRAGEMTDGHTVWPLKRCDSNYYCVSSPGLTFAAPKNLEHQQKAWAADGFNYKLVGKRKIEAFGQSVDTYLIEQDSPPRPWFLYSPEKGILAMGSFSSERPSFYWLDGSCGIGASCSLQPK